MLISPAMPAPRSRNDLALYFQTSESMRSVISFQNANSDDVRVDVDDQEVVELLAVHVARGVGQRVARVGLGGELRELTRRGLVAHASLCGAGMPKV